MWRRPQTGLGVVILSWLVKSQKSTSPSIKLLTTCRLHMTTRSLPDLGRRRQPLGQNREPLPRHIAPPARSPFSTHLDCQLTHASTDRNRLTVLALLCLASRIACKTVTLYPRALRMMGTAVYISPPSLLLGPQICSRVAAPVAAPPLQVLYNELF